MILKELRAYKVSFLRTNKQGKELGVADYASIASTWGVDTRGLQSQAQPGLHSETRSQNNRESKRGGGRRVTEGKKEIL